MSKNDFLAKITIRKKLMILTAFSSFIILILCIYNFGVNYYNTLYKERSTLLLNTTNIMADSINYYVNQAREGKISEEEAKSKSLALINNTRFLDDKGYFFAYNTDGVCVALPIKKEAVGTNRIDAKDKKGFKYIERMIELSKDKGGFIQYYFEKPGEDKSKTFPKLTYIEPIKGWDWLIGTGDYIDDIQNQVFSVIFNTIIVCFSFFIVVVLLLVNTIGKSIIKPIEDITDISRQLAENNLNIHIEDDENQTEIGELNRSFKKFITNLKDLIQEIYKSAENISASSEELSASAEQTTQGSQQVANSTQQLAQGAQEISTSIDTSVKTIEKMNKVIQEIYEESKVVAAIGDDNESNAVEGSKHVQNAVGKIDNIKNVAEDISETISKLGKLSSEIETIVDLINGIAGQTNLLALNAAIEAARAGEHGKGFAVVAEEVKILAGQSADATVKITSMIKEIQKETDVAVAKMNKATNEVDEGVEVVNEAGKALDTIIDKVKTANTKIQSISQDIFDVANNSQSIVSMVENIAAVTQETAASAEEISSITEEETASLEEISNCSHSLAKIAEELNKQVAVFKV